MMPSVKRRGAIIATCSLILVTAAAAVNVPVVAAKGGHQTPPSLAQTPVDATRVESLRAAANVIGDLGRTTFADTFSDITLDGAHHRVLVYVTSPARGQQLLSAARSRAPHVDLSLVVLLPSRYSRKVIDSGMARTMTPHYIKRFAITSAAASPDGSGIQVTTTSAAADPTTKAGRLLLASESRSLSQAIGIPVHVSHGSKIIPKSAQGLTLVAPALTAPALSVSASAPVS